MNPMGQMKSYDDLVLNQIHELRLITYRLEKAHHDRDRAEMDKQRDELQAAKTALDSMIGATVA